MGKVSKRMGIIKRETPPCLLNKTLGLVRNCSLEVEMIGEKNENLFFSHLWLKKRFLLGFLYLIWSSLSWLLQDLSFLSHVEYIYAEHKCFSSWQLLERRKTEFSVLCAFFFCLFESGFEKPQKPFISRPTSSLRSELVFLSRCPPPPIPLMTNVLQCLLFSLTARDLECRRVWCVSVVLEAEIRNVNSNEC